MYDKIHYNIKKIIIKPPKKKGGGETFTKYLESIIHH